MGGKGKKYANRKKNKQERKEKDQSSGEKSSENLQISSITIDDVEKKSEVISTSSSWEVDKYSKKTETDLIPEELQRRTQENKSLKSEVKKDENSCHRGKRDERDWEDEERDIRRGEKREHRHGGNRDERNDQPIYKSTEYSSRESRSAPRQSHQERNRSNSRTSSTEKNHSSKRDVKEDDERKKEQYDRDSYKKPKSYSERGEWERYEKKDEYQKRGNRDYSVKESNRTGRLSYQEPNRNNSRTSSASRDREFKEFESNYFDRNVETKNVVEKFGDLFVAGDEYSLGHCVAEDMNMGSGIATQFRSIFKRVDELLQQRVRQGGVATLHVDKRYIYYLVTKRYSSGKPTYETLFRSLRKMREHAEDNGVKKIALPRIGCGLDQLEWSVVKSMLQFIFKDIDVEIKIYNFQQDGQQSSTQPPKYKCPVKNVLKPIVDIESYTIIIYPCSKDQHITNTMYDLDKKFNIIMDYKKSRRNVGEVIRTDSKLNYIIYGVVVKEKDTDPINYGYFQRCINEINTCNNKKDQYEYVGMEAFIEREDSMVINKLVNLLRNTFYYTVSVYICWPEKLAQFARRDLEYS